MRPSHFGCAPLHANIIKIFPNSFNGCGIKIILIGCLETTCISYLHPSRQPSIHPQKHVLNASVIGAISSYSTNVINDKWFQMIPQREFNLYLKAISLRHTHEAGETGKPSSLLSGEVSRRPSPTSCPSADLTVSLPLISSSGPSCCTKPQVDVCPTQHFISKITHLPLLLSIHTLIL